MAEQKFKPRESWQTAEGHVDRLQDAILRVHEILVRALDIEPNDEEDFPYAVAYGRSEALIDQALSTLEIYGDMVREGEKVT